MKIIGIVAEYNPFHSGHKYQIEQAKLKYPDSLVAVVMSGNYVQRGDMAIMDKYTRAELAVRNGADLVIELPFPYACQNAELFANSAIIELKKLGVSAISFGCENADIDILKHIADIQINNKSDYEAKLKNLLADGLSYPSAVSKSIEEIIKSTKDITKNLYESNSAYINKSSYQSDTAHTSTINTVNDSSIASDILSPNNTLAIEYIRACMIHSFSPTFIPVQRHAAGHNDLDISNSYASATAIRSAVLNKNIEQIKDVVPEHTLTALKNYQSSHFIFNSLDNYLSYIYFKIISMGKDELRNIFDISEGIENKIYDNVYKHRNLEDFIISVKSKRFTYARIQRMLLNILLGITKEDIKKLKEYNNNYIRILAFNDNGKKIIKNAKSNDISVITKYSDFKRNGINTDNDLCFRLTSKSSDIYYLSAKDREKLINTEYINNAIYVKNTSSI